MDDPEPAHEPNKRIRRWGNDDDPGRLSAVDHETEVRGKKKSWQRNWTHYHARGDTSVHEDHFDEDIAANDPTPKDMARLGIPDWEPSNEPMDPVWHENLMQKRRDDKADRAHLRDNLNGQEWGECKNVDGRPAPVGKWHPLAYVDEGCKCTDTHTNNPRIVKCSRLCLTCDVFRDVSLDMQSPLTTNTKTPARHSARACGTSRVRKRVTRLAVAIVTVNVRCCLLLLLLLLPLLVWSAET